MGGGGRFEVTDHVAMLTAQRLCNRFLSIFLLGGGGVGHVLLGYTLL